MQESGFERRAQTNIQLYEQLLSTGYGMQDVGRVRAAYSLATRLFAGQLRPEGRPFVCHLVGVASILAMLKATSATIIAGLLHSAYTHGDFGLGRGRMTRSARARLRAAVGPEVELVVAGYSGHQWTLASVTDWATNVAGLESEMRQIIVIRLADLAEDALDSGLQLSAKAENPHRAIPVDVLAGLADALCYPLLGNSLRRTLVENQEADALAPLRDPHMGSYVVCPSSWREKLLPRLIGLARRDRDDD
jgi:(p)ppGpp synthase/HD superfamily hydrolase